MKHLTETEKQELFDILNQLNKAQISVTQSFLKHTDKSEHLNKSKDSLLNNVKSVTSDSNIDEILKSLEENSNNMISVVKSYKDLLKNN